MKASPMATHDQTIGEEVANSVSHGIGALLATAGIIALAWHARAQGTLAVVCCIVFGVTAFVAYLSSTLYHSLSRTRARDVFRAIDHASIFLLIAGSYTPMTLFVLRGRLGWSLFFVVWICAIAGVVLKSVAVAKFPVLSTVLYAGLGWTSLVAIVPLYRLLTHPAFALLVTGGLCYTIGILFFALRWKYAHFIWHLWVLAGTASHAAAIWIAVR